MPNTSVTDINSAGDMVGSFGDEATVGGIGKEHGFIVQGGVFTQIDFPGASSTAALGINRSDPSADC